MASRDALQPVVVSTTRAVLSKPPVGKPPCSLHSMPQEFSCWCGASLAASMSRYLIDRIDATPNIEVRPHTQVTQLHGDLPGGLAVVSWRDHQRGIEEERLIGHVFLFVGAEPETGWLEGCGVALDSHGFVLTGQPTAGRAAGHLPASLDSSVPGVFAVGDVRSGSVKRVGGAIGEGAAAVAQIHQYLAAPRPAPTGTTIYGE